MAWQRIRTTGGRLVLRNEDLDHQRCKPEFVQAMYEDLRWLGLDWDEGPDLGGPFAPYSQSERRSFYLKAWHKLRDTGVIYPCTCTRKDLERALQAPMMMKLMKFTTLVRAAPPWQPPSNLNHQQA